MARLDEATEKPVTMIAAPAGSGKSTLVRSWTESRASTVRSAWVAVERDERDEQRFWMSVSTALRKAVPDGVLLEPFSPTPAFDGGDFVLRLERDLALLDEPVVLVIDDVHELADPVLVTRLGWLLDRLPSSLRVVLLSRRDLQLGLHRRRLRGELTELRHADLQFTQAETQELIIVRGIDLSQTGVARLHERTEGWAAGLQLAMLSLESREDAEGFVAQFSGSDRTVAEYLIAEVLGTLPGDVLRLLLRTSVLERVNGELGDALAGGSASARHLQALADRGGFVIALDAQQNWYRFHRLFADFLALELRRTEPEVVPSLHLTAARWFAGHDLAIQAITHAQAGGDHPFAAWLLLENYFSLALDGYQASAHALLATYVLGARDDPPELLVVMANVELTTGSLEQVGVYLALAASGADRVPPERRHRFDLAVLLTRLTLARRHGDFRMVTQEPGILLPLPAASVSSDVAINNDVEALVLMNVGVLEVWAGHLDTGSAHLREARRRSQKIGRPYLEVGCLAHLAQAATWTSFAQARDLGREALALAEEHGWGEDPVAAPALVALGTALVQAGAIADGEEYLLLADHLISPDVEPAVAYSLHMARVARSFALGEYAGAVAGLEEGIRLAERLVNDSSLALQLRAGLLFGRLKLDDTDGVRRAIDQLSVADRESGEMREIAAAVALVDGLPQAALEAVQPVVDGSVAARHPVILLRCLLYAAQALLALEQPRAAADAVERALDIAEHDSLVLPFLFLDARELLVTHSRVRTAHAGFLQEVLDVFSGAPSGVLNRTSGMPLDALSDAELRVLRFLSTNLTAASVGRELHVSTHTIKTHMHHIYVKLDVHTRGAAVTQGRRLGLLGEGRHG